MTKRTIVEVVVAIIVIAAFFLVSVFKWEKGEEYLVKYTPVVIAVTSVVDKLISDTTSDTLAIIDAAMKTAKEQFEKEYNRPPDNKELNQLKDIVTELLRLKKLPGKYDSDLSSQGP